MAKAINLIRNTNAILKPKEINTFGKRWAVQDGADGYPMVNVIVTDTTQDVKMYLEGSNDITVFPVASDVSKLCKSALTSFPKINTIFLFSATKVNIEEQTKGLGDYLSYLSLLSKIYVPSALLDDYQSSYASLSSKFDIIVEDLTITIEWIGNNTLTSEEITRQLNTLESAYLNQATKLVIDDRYTDYMDALWAYNFTEKCSLLNNNLWYGTTKVSFASYTIADNTQDHILTASVVETELAKISADKITLIEKIIVPVDFTSYASGSITEIQAFMTTNSIDKLGIELNFGSNIDEMELSLSGDIIARITSIGKTLEEALIYAKQQNINPKTTNYFGDTNLIIVACLYNRDNYGGDFRACTNLVYAYNIKYNNGQGNNLFHSDSNLIAAEKISFAGIISSNYNWFVNTGSVKRIEMTFDNNVIITTQDTMRIDVQTNLEKLIMNNFKFGGVGINNNAPITRQDLIDFFNSLGTPATTINISIGANNLAKLTNADIQLAYNKNFIINPTPSAFTFTIGGNTYSCDFGMTWNTWIASAYNTDGYTAIGGFVLDSNGNPIQLDSENVDSYSMIRYGDIFTIDTQTVIQGLAQVKGLGSENPTDVSFNVDSTFQDLLDDLNDGTNDVIDTYNNVFVEIPTIYRKVLRVVDNQIVDMAMSLTKFDNTWLPYPCFVKPNGVDVMPYVRIGKYLFSSTTQATSVNATYVTLLTSTARALARSVGTGYQLYDWQMARLIQDLIIVNYKTVNVTPSSLFLGINNLATPLDGMGVKGTSWLLCYNPDNYIDEPTEESVGYVSAGYASNLDSWQEIKKLGYDTNNPFFNFPSEVISNNGFNTYYCDWYQPGYNGLVCNAIGGSWEQPWAWWGVFNCEANISWSANMTQRLCYRPINE